MAKIKANSTESRTLGTLRDLAKAGLPKLLNGELKTAAAAASLTVSA